VGRAGQRVLVPAGGLLSGDGCASPIAAPGSGGREEMEAAGLREGQGAGGCSDALQLGRGTDRPPCPGCGAAPRTPCGGQLGSSLGNLIFAQAIKTLWWCCWLNYPFVRCIRRNPSRYVPSTPATFVRLSRLDSWEIIPSIWRGSVLLLVVPG